MQLEAEMVWGMSHSHPSILVPMGTSSSEGLGLYMDLYGKKREN